MNIPLYILGFLSRYGAQHGYRLKRLIAETVADAADIKLPTVYYHLEKMQQQGYIVSSRDRKGRRPERLVYDITEAGKKALDGMLGEALQFDYKPRFAADAVFFFMDAISKDALIETLNRYRERLEAVLDKLDKDSEAAEAVPDIQTRDLTEVVYSHHRHHYLAEVRWLSDTIDRLVAKGSDISS